MSSVPSALVESYHAITCGQPLLTVDGHDFFPRGDEPRFRRAPSVDTPDCAGLADGPIYDRGNVRWTMSLTRVREFFGFAFPLTIASGVTAANPAEAAQKWLAIHLNALPHNITALAWTGVKTWPSASVEADGTTDGGYAMVTYNITMSNAAN